MILPVAVTLVVVDAGDRWYPSGDFSHTELLLRALPRHPPLVGVAARVGDITGTQGSTPGPSMAYLLTPVYWLLGRTSFAMLVSVAVLHAAGIAVAVWIARRLGGRETGLAVAVALALTVRSLAPVFFVEPWNVWVPVFAFAAFLLAIWAVAGGRPGWLVPAVAIGVHCVQTHISYLVPVVGLLGLSVVRLVWLRVRTERLGGRRLARWGAIAVGVGVIGWIPPIVEQLRHKPGNLRMIFDEFSDPGEPYVGLGAAFRALAGELNLAGGWLVGAGHEPTDAPNLVGLLGFAVLIGAGIVVGWRRRDRAVLELQAVLVAATALGLLAASRVFGVFFDYVIRWTWPLAALWAGVSVASLWRNVSLSPQRISGTAPRRLVAVAGAGLLVASAAGVVKATDARMAYELDSRMIGALAAQAAPQLSRDVPYLLRRFDPAALGGGAYGLVLELERRGFHVYVEPWGRAGVLPLRVREEPQTAAVLWLVTGERAIDEFAARQDATLLARVDPRSPAQAARAAQLRTELEDRLRRLGRADLIDTLDTQYGQTIVRFFGDLPPAERAMVIELNDLRLPGALFEVPIGAPVYP